MLAPGRARRYTENMKQVPVYREAVEVPALPGLFIRPLESSLLEKAQAHLDNLTKPRGSLGRLEELGRRLYAMAGGVTPLSVSPALMLTVAGDHGVTAQGVSPMPQAVTRQMTRNFLNGGAGVNVLCRSSGMDLRVVDAGCAGGPYEPHELLIDRRLLALMLVCGAVACTLPFVRSRIGYLFTPQFADSNARGGRAKRWATAIGYLKATDPVFGMGYGMYGGAVAVQNPVLPWVEYMYVDNYYVKILTENGIVGVTAFGMMLLGLVGNGLRACVRTAKTRWSPLCAGMLCGLIGVLIHSVFESIWEEPYMMALFFAVAAMLAWAGLLRRRTQETA